MRLTLVIYSLSSGGAERVMSIMANYWAAKWKITLITFTSKNLVPFYDLDSRITHIALDIEKKSHNTASAVFNNLKRVKILRSAIVDSKPDAVISFLDTTNVVTILSTRGLNIPVIISDRDYPGKNHVNIWQKLCNWTYPYANRIILQTQRAKKQYSSKIQLLTSVIPNPVLFPATEITATKKDIGKPSIIAVGRLELQKGFDLLLKAFAQVKGSYPEWTLTILGEGSLRPELESLRKKLELEHCVHLPGRVKNIYTFLQQADLFVLSSRHEGFPNVLCEAMACGLPIISTDCPFGPREIIRDGIDGILVANEDVTALATAMSHLMLNEPERKRLSKQAGEIVTRFKIDSVMNIWEETLKEVIV